MAKIKIMQFKLNMYFVKHDTGLKSHTILILLHFYCWFSRGKVLYLHRITSSFQSYFQWLST